MFALVTKFIAEITGQASEEHRFGETDHRLAAAALLVHAIAIDGVVGTQEKDKLRAVVMRQFDLSEEEARVLIRQAREKDREAIDLYSFTSVLTRALDQEGRQKVIEMMWEIVYADGAVHEFEDNLVWRTAELMGVSTPDRIRLKNKARRRATTEAGTRPDPQSGASQDSGDSPRDT